MPNKIKIALTLVAIVAVFLVYQLAQYVHAVANGNSTFQQSSPLPNPDDDPDHDGLNNQQEVIWGTDPFNPDSDGDGFKDGEEVNSGHNPLVPGPDDLINSGNLTDQLSELAASGIYAGALKPDNENYDQTLNDITSSVADSGIYLFNKTIDVSSFNVINGSAQTNTTYVQTTAPLFQQFSNALGNELAHIKDNLLTIGKGGFSDSVKNFFTQQSTVYASISKTGLTVSVPRPLLKIHTDFMSLSSQMQTISEALANGDKDTVKAALALDALGNMYTKYIDLLSAYGDTLQNISLDNNLLNNLPK